MLAISKPGNTTPCGKFLTGSGANGKYTPEELALLELEDVKKLIIAVEPKAFDKKAKAPAKKKVAKKK